MKDKPIVNEEKHIEENKSKGKEEVIIKYGFIALGIILAICIIAFGVISLLPNNILSIGNKKITEDEFDYHYFEQANMLYQEVLKYYPEIGMEAFMLSEYQSGMTYHEFAKQLALERISEVTILTDMAEKEGYTYDKKELEDSKDNFRKNFNEYAAKSKLTLDETAKELYGSKFDIVMKIYEKTWISSKYQDDMLRRFETEVSDEDALKYYENFKDDLDKITLKQIFIATYDKEAQAAYDDEKYADAKTRAESLLAKANKGEDYDKLIMEHSEDPSIADTLGEYTSRKSEISLAKLMDWVFSAERKVGEIGLVETEIGFHIVKYISRTGYDEALKLVKSNIAYGRMLDVLSAKRKMPEYEVGYYKTFSSY